MGVPKVLAVVFVLMGIGFVAWGVLWMGDDTYFAAGISLLLTGVAFVGVAAVMLLLATRLSRAKRADDPLARAGIPGQATILSIRETGISFRGETEILVGFELLVQVPGQNPYQVSLEQGVPRIVLGGVLPGSTVAVRVDPSDPQNVAIDFSAAPMAGGFPGVVPGMPAGSLPGAVPGMPAGGFPGAVPGGVAGLAGAVSGAVPGGGTGLTTPGGIPVAKTERAADLLATGTPAWATVVAAQDLGMDVSQTGLAPDRPDQADDRIYLFTLQVHLDGQQPFTAVVGHRVPDSMLGQIQPGMSVRVAVDPANPTQSVAIDWGVG